MKILLLSPGHFPWYRTDSTCLWYPRLGLRSLAALTPASDEVTILEGKRARNVDFDVDVDLVGISILTPHAPLSYQFADAFRVRGVPVVLGGPHPSLLPEEASQHADAVVVGEAEPIWVTLLDDARRGQLAPMYRAERGPERDQLPIPVRLDTDREDFPDIFPIETGRGCWRTCEYCLVPSAFGQPLRLRPVGQIVAEVELARQRSVGRPRIVFSENLLGNPLAQTLPLLRALEPLEVKWSAEGDLFRLDHPEYLEAAKRAGCFQIYIETQMYGKEEQPKLYEMYRRTVRRIMDAGISASINLTIGCDDHDESIFDDAFELLSEGDAVRCSYFQLLVPWPGTPLFVRLDQEGRILTKDWCNYNNIQVVFRPKLIRPERLYELYMSSLREQQQRIRAVYASCPPAGHQPEV